MHGVVFLLISTRELAQLSLKQSPNRLPGMVWTFTDSGTAFFFSPHFSRQSVQDRSCWESFVCSEYSASTQYLAQSNRGFVSVSFFFLFLWKAVFKSV